MKSQLVTSSKPLVTFALFAYNQEPFVREAVEGALAQTYSPLEIILSDDCSTDRTYSIMKEVAESYSGNNKVILNKNTYNMGIGSHINKVMEISNGDLIIVAAGDDISLPNRSNIIVNYWLDGEDIYSLYSNSIIINDNGFALGSLNPNTRYASKDLLWKMLNRMPGVHGATHAWHRAVFDVFGPMLPGTVYEDRVIPLRSELLGKVVYIDEPLVKYRVHENNISIHKEVNDKELIKISCENHFRNVNVFYNYLHDLMLAGECGFLENKKKEYYLLALSKEINVKKDRAAFIRGGGLEKLNMIRKNVINNPKQSCIWLAMLLFPSIFMRLKRKELGIK